MSTAHAFPLITVEEFFDLPEPSGDFTYELHFGGLVEVGRGKKRHLDLQSVIKDILARTLAPGMWRIELEMPYGLTAGYDARAADVGVMLRETWDAVADNSYPIGSPDLVVQVKSRSNRDRRMEADAIDHITHGATAVLLVRPEREEIVMINAASRTVYGPSHCIELPAPLSVSISVGEIFHSRPA